MDEQSTNLPKTKLDANRDGSGRPPYNTAQGFDDSGGDHLSQYLACLSQDSAVIGSVMFGNDGFVLADTMPPDFDTESIGVWALGLYMNTENVSKKMGYPRVRHFISRTSCGTFLVADFGDRLVATLSDGKDMETLTRLIGRISKLPPQEDSIPRILKEREL
jgi:predicted regulator of Ras-like GTPase activity (Roadblock/LC7/MglB family)